MEVVQYRVLCINYSIRLPTYDVARERLLDGLPVLGEQALCGRQVDGLLHATVTHLCNMIISEYERVYS